MGLLDYTVVSRGEIQQYIQADLRFTGPFYGSDDVPSFLDQSACTWFALAAQLPVISKPRTEVCHVDRLQ